MHCGEDTIKNPMPLHATWKSAAADTSKSVARLPLLLAADRALLQLLFQKETEAVCTYAGLR